MQVYTCIPKITMPFVVSFLKKDFIQVPVKLQKCILLFVWQYQSEYEILISTYM